MTNIRYVSVFLSFCFSVFLSFCLSVFLSFCLSVSMSLCLSVFLSSSRFLSIKTNFGTHFLSFVHAFYQAIKTSNYVMQQEIVLITLRRLAEGKLIGVDPIYVASPQSWPISPERARARHKQLRFALQALYSLTNAWKQLYIKNINSASTLDLHCLHRPPSGLEKAGWGTRLYTA